MNYGSHYHKEVGIIFDGFGLYLQWMSCLGMNTFLSRVFCIQQRENRSFKRDIDITRLHLFIFILDLR